jgi:hypothetical protein
MSHEIRTALLRSISRINHAISCSEEILRNTDRKLAGIAATLIRETLMELRKEIEGTLRSLPEPENNS